MHEYRFGEWLSNIQMQKTGAVLSFSCFTLFPASDLERWMYRKAEVAIDYLMVAISDVDKVQKRTIHA